MAHVCECVLACIQNIQCGVNELESKQLIKPNNKSQRFTNG